MKVNIIGMYYFVVLLLLIYGVKLLFDAMIIKKYTYVFRQRDIYRHNKIIDSCHEEINHVLQKAGVNISLKKYNQIRIVLLSVSIISVSLLFFESDQLFFYLGIAFLTYSMFTPKLYIGKNKTPFFLLLDVFRHHFNIKKDKELYRFLVQLRNIIVTRKDNPYSTDYTINELLKFTSLTTKAFLGFLMFYNMGREEEAYEKFVGEINTDIGNEVGIILLKLDKLNPVELMEQINIVKGRIRERQITLKYNHQNRVSNLIYLPIIVPIFILLLNFIMITIWIPRIESTSFFN